MDDWTLKAIVAASYFSKLYPMVTQDRVPSLKEMCTLKLTPRQQTIIVGEYEEQYPQVVKKIKDEVKSNYNRVIFDINWFRGPIKRNTVSTLIKKFPDSFKTPTNKMLN